jgi:hypothetical protein
LKYTQGYISLKAENTPILFYINKRKNPNVYLQIRAFDDSGEKIIQLFEDNNININSDPKFPGITCDATFIQKNKELFLTLLSFWNINPDGEY